MAIKIAYTISDEDYHNLKKQYEKNKAKLGNVTFDEFITKSLDIALKSHIQFSMMNEHMIDLFSDFGLNAFGDINKTAKQNLSKIDDLVNKFFQDSVKTTNKKNNESSSHNETNTSTASNDKEKDSDKKLN